MRFYENSNIGLYIKFNIAAVARNRISLWNVPIILILFYGVVEIDKLSIIGLIIGIITGIGVVIPFIIHKVIVKKTEHFNLLISNMVIYFNILTGIALLIFIVQSFT